VSADRFSLAHAFTRLILLSQVVPSEVLEVDDTGTPKGGWVFTAAGLVAGVAKAVDVVRALTGDGCAIGDDVELGSVFLACVG
jgi:hypothetical protein